MIDTINIGLPKGNLNKLLTALNRGHTYELLRLAGFIMKYYEPGREGKDKDGNPVEITAEGEPHIKFFCMKPKQFPELLERGQLDLAIMGRDAVEEYYARLWQDVPDFKLETPHNFREDVLPTQWVEHMLFGDNRNMNEDLTKVLKTRRRWWGRIEEKVQQLISKGIRMGDGTTELIDLGYGKVDVNFGIKQDTLEMFQNPEYRDHFENIWDIRTLGMYNPLRAVKERKIGGFSPLTIASAYPNLTYKELSKYLSRRFLMFASVPLAVQNSQDYLKNHRYRMEIDNDLDRTTIMFRRVDISNVPSSTEAIKSDIYVDCVASGKSFEENNLVKVGQPLLKNSTARLYFRNLNDSKEINSFGNFRKESESDLTEFERGNRYCGAEERDEYFKSCSRFEQIREIVKRLQAASVKYGKLYKDSIYHPSNNQQTQGGAQ